MTKLVIELLISNSRHLAISKGLLPKKKLKWLVK